MQRHKTVQSSKSLMLTREFKRVRVSESDKRGSDLRGVIMTTVTGSFHSQISPCLKISRYRGHLQDDVGVFI
jgi:hypothetical protein